MFFYCRNGVTGYKMTLLNVSVFIKKNIIKQYRFSVAELKLKLRIISSDEFSTISRIYANYSLIADENKSLKRSKSVVKGLKRQKILRPETTILTQGTAPFALAVSENILLTL